MARWGQEVRESISSGKKPNKRASKTLRVVRRRGVGGGSGGWRGH